jgi:phosphoglycerol transferase MdoB-like AlkP superfamily enzyme
MLQRKQTLWMLLSIICAALTFKFSFYSGNVRVGADGHVFRSLNALPTFVNGGSGNILILIVTILILAGTLVNLFNFKARNKQLWITIGLIVLSLVNILLYYRASGTPSFIEGKYDLTAVLTLAIPVFLIMAARGIRKDQKLVKSADRLR